MKKYYPKIKFSINKKLEKDFFIMFSDNRLAMRPELRFLFDKKFKKDRNVFLINYVDNFYRLNRRAIMEDLKAMERKWKKVEKYFYKRVDKIFYNFSWPRGSYRAYASIWNMFPRFIKNKYFTVPVDLLRYKNKNIDLFVIAHEMLHFITYDYLQKKFKLKPSEYRDKDNKFWQFTENLNVLIEKEKYWKIFVGKIESKPYKSCERLYRKMEKIWRKNKDIDNLIKEILL